MKTSTDKFWNERALTESNTEAVNIADRSQRQLETTFILPHLSRKDTILEVGCGNGFLTNILRSHVKHVDAFDYAENMVAQAQTLYGETNNRFFADNITNPSEIKTNYYNTVVCVRVLINLADREEQIRALRNMHSALRPGGQLLLIEGFMDGFEEINALRKNVGLSPMSPAKINYYSYARDLQQTINELFAEEDTFHTGMFDFLTRVVYPSLAGAENAVGHCDFHDKITPIAAAFNIEALKPLARLRGYKLRKK